MKKTRAVGKELSPYRAHSEQQADPDLRLFFTLAHYAHNRMGTITIDSEETRQAVFAAAKYILEDQQRRARSGRKPSPHPLPESVKRRERRQRAKQEARKMHKIDGRNKF